MLAIATRFKGYITEVDIVNWLENFQKEDWRAAIRILEKTDFLTNEEIIECFNYHLKSITSLHPDKEIIIIPANEEFGKSATAMIYNIQKTDAFRSSNIRIVQRPGKIKRGLDSKNQILVLVDDFLGTGKTLEGFINQYIPMFRDKGYDQPIWVVCAFVMSEAKDRLNRIGHDVIVLGEERSKCFSPYSNVFGKKHASLREFSFQEGKNLFVITDRVTKISTPHPLGFENSQSLVAFSHTTPNNSLPILWASSHSHHPIFPRSSTPRIDRMKKMRNESSYWLYHARKLGFVELVSVFEENSNRAKLMNIDIRFIALLRLLKQRRPVPVICQYLGILESDYLELIEIGVQRGILDQNEGFTEKGNNYYLQLLHEVKLIKSKKKRIVSTPENEDIYVPTMFRGRA